MKPARIFLAFALGIVLPAGFLSYIGFRSFKTEGQVLHQEAENRYRSAADLLQKNVADVLTPPQDALQKLATSRDFLRNDLSAMTRLLASTPLLAGTTVENWFYIDAKENLLFPVTERPSGSMEWEPAWGPLTDEIHHLDQLEFRDKQLTSALQGYQHLDAAKVAAPERAVLLQAIAGLSRKTGDAALSEITCRRLIHQYDQTLAPSGEPMGLLARRELAALDDAQGKKEEACRKRLDILDDIAWNHWPVLPHKSTLINELNTSIEKELARLPQQDLQKRWRAIRERQNQLQQNLIAAQAFMANAWPEATRRLRARGWSDRGGILRGLPQPWNEKWILIAPVWNSANDRRLGTFAAVVGSNVLRQAAETVTRQTASAYGLQAQLMIDGKPPSWKPLLTRDLFFLDPPVQLRITEESVSPEGALSRKRLWMFGGVIGLSFIVILIGLLLMWHTTQREMELSGLKADFVASVSHELRTPLSSISYIAERLTRGRYRSEAEVQELYAMLTQESGRLQELIEDVLDFSRMLAGKKTYDFEMMDLREAAQESIARLKGKSQAEGFTMETDPFPQSLPIRADRKAVVQAVTNLLDNAMKYSGNARRIQVAFKKTADQAMVSVTDKGVGIAEQEQGRIFEKFYRARDTSDIPGGGVGLGLAMVRHIMDAHQGTIIVNSVPNQGSVFTLGFPL